MFALAQHIIDEHQTQQLIVTSPDTDVLVVAWYQFMSELATLNRLWLKTRIQEKRGTLPYMKQDGYGCSMLEVRQAFHAISGSFLVLERRLHYQF